MYFAQRCHVELVARGHDVVRDVGEHVLERIARLQRGIGLVAADIGIAFVVLRIEPHAAGRIARRDLERQALAGGFDDAAADRDIDELHAVRCHAHRAPLRTAFERIAQHDREIARLGLAHLGIDALLRQRIFIGGNLCGNAGIERMHHDVEPLLGGNLAHRLLRIYLGQRLDVFDDAAREQRACRQRVDEDPHFVPLVFSL